MTGGEQSADVLQALHVLEYPYERSVGPALGRFFTALRDGRIEGVIGDNGRVIVPPTEYDPESSRTLSEFVAVGDSGVVTSWCWVSDPLGHHLLDRPFAFALIRLDGAGTALLHMVDAYRPEKMSTGMRVRANWRQERVGHITDIVCFVPVEASELTSTAVEHP